MHEALIFALAGLGFATAFFVGYVAVDFLLSVLTHSTKNWFKHFFKEMW